MILLELHNRAVEDILNNIFELAKQESRFEKVNFTVADFDNVIYTLGNPDNNKKRMNVSIYFKFYNELKDYPIEEVMTREYGLVYQRQPDQGQSVTLTIDLERLPEDHVALAHKCALLKRNCFAAVFEKFFEYQAQSQNKQAVINYRTDEAMYIQSMHDRVTVTFATLFKDPDDMLIGKVFMQEFTEVRRRLDRAPQVLYSQRVPPSELQGIKADTNDNVAYITFILFQRHLTPGPTQQTTIDQIHTFRNYLHYHIKCSKAYIQMRMRAKTVEFLKVLNRAMNDFDDNPVINVTPVGEFAASIAGNSKSGMERGVASTRMLRMG